MAGERGEDRLQFFNFCRKTEKYLFPELTSSMPNKEKSKVNGGEIQTEIPAEWIRKSVEELKSLVVQYESDVLAACNSRNLAQVEHSSIQSFYDVTTQDIRELDMQIEKKDVEIEHVEDENMTELRIYQQKAYFIKYCHDSKVKEVLDAHEAKMKNAVSDHAQKVKCIEDVKTSMKNEIVEAELEHSTDIKCRQNNNDLAIIRGKLEADVNQFQQLCDNQKSELVQELDLRRTAELRRLNSVKESHLSNLLDSHQSRCNEMQSHFAVIERQQVIDIEDLETEIRRLKKSALENATTSSQLKSCNERSNKELKTCLDEIAALKRSTKDKVKNATSLETTNLRLSATSKAVNEARKKYKSLQDKFDAIERERNYFRDGSITAVSEAMEPNKVKRAILKKELKSRRDTNAVIDQHLLHTISSARLDKAKSDVLIANMHDSVKQSNTELENLNLAIADATDSYNKLLKSSRTELFGLGVSQVQVDSLGEAF